MINKPLNALEEEKLKFEQQLKNCTTEEEKIVIYNNYYNELKLFLFEANKTIYETFGRKISPYYSETGYDGLYKSQMQNFVLKTKKEFLTEINNIILSDIYNSQNSEIKTQVKLAIYILKTYYEKDLQ